jgi:hypothetical protein
MKLGLMKNLVKEVDKNDKAIKFPGGKFPQISEAKFKERIFDGSQVRKLLKDTALDTKLNELESLAWTSFKAVTTSFLANRKDPNYLNLVKDLLENYKNLGYCMSLKISFLYSYLDFFPENLGSVNDEQDKCFHRQEISAMEERYQGRWDPAMMGDYCWFL